MAVDRDTILAQYFERGFPNVTFEWSSQPGSAPNRMDLRFSIGEGREQFVRQVVTTGLSTTRAGLVNRRLTLSPGDPLSLTRITDIQRSLYDLGVFAKVDAAIQDPEGETDRKYVLYDIDEARRYSVAVGFGAELGRIGGCQTCYDAPAGATGFSPRVSLDFTRNNLWGLAHSLSLRTRASTLDQRALLNYSWPRFRNRDSLNSLVHRPVRALARRAHVQLQARRGVGAVVAKAQQVRHPAVSLRVPPGGHQRPEDHAVSHSRSFRSRCGWG